MSQLQGRNSIQAERDVNAGRDIIIIAPQELCAKREKDIFRLYIIVFLLAIGLFSKNHLQSIRDYHLASDRDYIKSVYIEIRKIDS